MRVMLVEDDAILGEAVRDHIASSIHLDREDLDMTPFDGKGGLSQMYQLFGEHMEPLIVELNEALAA